MTIAQLSYRTSCPKCLQSPGNGCRSLQNPARRCQPHKERIDALKGKIAAFEAMPYKEMR